MTTTATPLAETPMAPPSTTAYVLTSRNRQHQLYLERSPWTCLRLTTELVFYTAEYSDRAAYGGGMNTWYDAAHDHMGTRIHLHTVVCTVAMYFCYASKDCSNSPSRHWR
jgi:hypothetical protein